MLYAVSDARIGILDWQELADKAEEQREKRWETDAASIEARNAAKRRRRVLRGRLKLVEAEVHRLRMEYYMANSDPEEGYGLKGYCSRQDVFDTLKDSLYATEAEYLGYPLEFIEIHWAWKSLFPLCVPWYDPGFLDVTGSYGCRLLWDHVANLEPLQQSADAEGRVLFRTNSRSCRKLKHARHCALEALVFATGWTLTRLNCTGFNDVESGVKLHNVNMRLRKTPFHLTGWTTVVSKANGGERGSKRGHDGVERRSLISLFALLTGLPAGIVLAEAIVCNDEGSVTSVHTVVWDAWRRILFFGPGEYKDRELDGALLVEAADLQSETHVCPSNGVSLSEHVRSKFGISGFRRAHVLMVAAKRVGETEHV